MRGLLLCFVQKRRSGLLRAAAAHSEQAVHLLLIYSLIQDHYIVQVAIIA